MKIKQINYFHLVYVKELLYGYTTLIPLLQEKGQLQHRIALNVVM